MSKRACALPLLSIWVLAALGGGCSNPDESTIPDIDDDRVPVVKKGMRSIDEDETATISLLENAKDPQGFHLRVSDVESTLPQATILDPFSDKVTIAPPRDFHGEILLRYSVSNFQYTVRTEYRIEVRPVNDPPEAVSYSRRFRFSTLVPLLGRDVELLPLTFQVLSQPRHGTLTGTPPNLTYTAAAGYVGSDSFTYRASDGAATSPEATITLEAHLGTAPQLSPRVAAVDEDVPANLTLTAVDADGDAVTFVIDTPPAHGTLSGAPPNLVYTPAANSFGLDSFTYTASDGILAPSSGSFTLNVQSVNDRPVATPLQVSTAEDRSVAITLSGSDIEGSTLSYQVRSMPAHGTLSGSGASWTFQPAANYHGEDSFTYSVFDGSLTSTTATVSLSISSLPDAPVAGSFTVPVLEDTTQVVTLRGSDGDGDAVTYTMLSTPAHGRLEGVAPALTYTPDANYFGTETLTYTATAGGETSTVGTVTLQVSDVNDAPVAGDAAVATLEDTPVTFTLTSSDIDGSAPSYSIVTAPSDGVLSSGSGAARTYTPAANAHGTRSFTFRVSDGRGGTDTAVVTIDISSVNDAPTLADERVVTEAATPITVQVLDNDLDVEGDSFELASVTPPAHGTVVIEGDQLVYTPEQGFLGVEEVSYVVTDEHGASSTARAHIGVETLPSGMPQAVIATAGTVPNTVWRAPSLSADGRFIAFLSRLALVPTDTNGFYDVYLYDRGLGRLSLVSTSTAGGLANADCHGADVSGNGRYVVFHSSATNLVAGDTNAKVDVFRHDRVTGETVRVSVTGNGGQANGDSYAAKISDDGKVVAFLSSAFNLVGDDAAGAVDVFVRELAAGTTVRVSVSSSGGEADNASSELALSGDGQVIAFASVATNLVAGDSNAAADVFVHERATGVTSRVSVSSTGGQADDLSYQPSLSRDGRFVGFLSLASSLVPSPTTGNTYVRDRVAQTTTRPGTYGDATSLSGDGRYLVQLSDSAVRVRDRFAGISHALTTTIFSRWLHPSVSRNSRYVVYLDSQQGTVIVAPNPL